MAQKEKRLQHLTPQGQILILKISFSAILIVNKRHLPAAMSLFLGLYSRHITRLISGFGGKKRKKKEIQN